MTVLVAILIRVDGAAHCGALDKSMFADVRTWLVELRAKQACCTQEVFDEEGRQRSG